MKLNEVTKKDLTISFYSHETPHFYSGKRLTVTNKVDISGYGLKEIPSDFYKTTHYFDCNDNNIFSLKGCPEIVGEDFSCRDNMLTTLEFGPKKLVGNYSCRNNKLITLEGAPSEINGEFDCENNKLTSLKHCPKKVKGNFNAGRNLIDTIEYLPESVKSLDLGHNKLISLVGIHKVLKKCETLILHNNNIEEGGLGILLIEGLYFINCNSRPISGPLEFKQAIHIIQKYTSVGKKGLLACQEELIENGLERFAKI